VSVSQRPCGKSVLSLDLNLDSESQRIIVSGNEFQTVGAEQRKA